MNPNPPPSQSKPGLIQRFPLLVLFLSAAAILSGWCAWEQYRLDVEVREHGIAVRNRSFMDLLALPGIMPLYYVASVTNSPVFGLVAFAVGMAVTYGGVGLAMDFVVKGLGRGARGRVK